MCNKALSFSVKLVLTADRSSKNEWNVTYVLQNCSVRDGGSNFVGNFLLSNKVLHAIFANFLLEAWHFFSKFLRANQSHPNFARKPTIWSTLPIVVFFFSQTEFYDWIFIEVVAEAKPRHRSRFRTSLCVALFSLVQKNFLSLKQNWLPFQVHVCEIWG